MCKGELSKAIDFLKKGALVVYPTDTLYGLGADVFNIDSVRKVFLVKNRPFSVPLPVAVSDIDMLNQIAFADKRAKLLVDVFLPGPLTLILKKKSCVSDLVTSGSSKVAVRIPENDFALKMIKGFGPVTVTSANIHGEKTPGIINDVEMQFKQGDIGFYVNSGRLEGKPSTIVDVTSEKIEIIREGVISKDMILDVI